MQLSTTIPNAWSCESEIASRVSKVISNFANQIEVFARKLFKQDQAYNRA